MGGLIERSIEFSSSAPKGRSKAASAVGVERSGLIVVVNLTRTVKSAESWQSQSVIQRVIESAAEEIRMRSPISSDSVAEGLNSGIC